MFFACQVCYTEFQENFTPIRRTTHKQRKEEKCAESLNLSDRN
jgi:hypothetical protein